MSVDLLTGVTLPPDAGSHERLGSSIWRIRLDPAAPMRTLVAKHLSPEVATTVELTLRRWLPAAGLEDAGPALFDAARAPNTGEVWHLYEDLGDGALDESGHDEERLRAMVTVVARVHRSFVAHPLLGEVLGRGRDLTAWAHESMLRSLLRALEAVRPDSTERSVLRAWLLARFMEYFEEAPSRAAKLRELGGANTLVHGDLWPKNGIVVGTESGLRARLVDWDRCGVGSGFYDLSTLLSRLPHAVREHVVAWYRAETDLLDSALSDPARMNFLAETCERTRLAEWAIWRVRSIPSPDAAWAWGELARAEDWLEIPPLFPEAVAT